MNRKNMLKTSEAAKIAGVNLDTIRRWDSKGLIKSYRTEGGHRRYCAESIYAYIGQPKVQPTEKCTLIYARVSTRDRENSLNRQVELLEKFCSSKGWKHKTITDIGSGFNFRNEGLLELIKQIETNQLDRLVINDKERLLAFGTEIIFEMCKWHNVEVVIVSEDETLSISFGTK